MSTASVLSPAGPRETSGNRRSYGCFVRQQQAFGLDVAFLREVVHTRNVTPVPAAPASVAGVISLRGEILPVVLIDSLLGLQPEPFAPRKPILVLRRDDFLVGVQVDVVERVETFPREEILPSPLAAKYPYFTAIHHSRQRSRLTNLLDAAALIDQLAGQVAGGAGAKSKSATPDAPDLEN